MKKELCTIDLSIDNKNFLKIIIEKKRLNPKIKN